MAELLWTAAAGETCATMILAHGAGAGMDTPFMSRIADGLAENGVASVRFEFAYMAQRRTGGKKRPPPRADKLIGEFRAVVETVAGECSGPLLIGGKSMGGRVAAMLAGETGLDPRVGGVICLGYPFHPTGKPDDWRMAPLEEARLPVLIAQGERDPFGNRGEVEATPPPGYVQIVWLSDGSHDLAPRGRAEATWSGNLAIAARAVADFAERSPAG